MTPAELEAEVLRRFPVLSDAVAANTDAVHGLVHSLYRYVQGCIADGRFEEIGRVFELLDEAWISSWPEEHIEEALRFSFFCHFFEYRGHRARIRRLMGPAVRRLITEEEGEWGKIMRYANEVYVTKWS